jgi:hypothetical protein
MFVTSLLNVSIGICLALSSEKFDPRRDIVDMLLNVSRDVISNFE